MSRTGVRRVAMLAAVLAVGAGTATAAARHLKLLRSIPAAGARVPAGALPPVQLWFSQRPELAVTSVRLAPAGAASGGGRLLAPLTRDTARRAPIVAATAGVSLTPGAWVLTWRTMALDGHVLSGTIPFTVTATPGR